MKILYSSGIDLSLPQGHAVHVRRLCEALERRGHELRLVARPARAPLRWPGPSGGLVCAGGWALPRLRHLTAETRAARTIRRELESYRPDLHLARAEAFTFAPLLAPRRAAPLVVECNSALDAFLRAGGSPAWTSPLLRRLERSLLRAAAAVGAVTAALLERAASRHGVPRDRLFLVPNGAWLPPEPGDEALRLRRRHGVEDGACLLAFAGNLHPVQGLDRVLEAMARDRASGPDTMAARGSMQARRGAGDAAPIRLWIAGESPERAALEALAARLGLAGRVRFLGGLPEEEAVLHLQASQAVVAPYPVAGLAAVAGDPLKVLQGLASDRPVLACAHAGWDPLLGNPALRVVGADDAAAWARAIRALADDWTRAGRPLRDWPWPDGTGPGREWVRAHRTWDHTAAAWELAFARALTSSTRRSRG